MTRRWQNLLAAKAILGLGDQASLQEIRTAYRKLCQAHHPDRAARGGGEGASARMQEINAAYTLLLEYATTYRLPLLPTAEGAVAMEPEEWWLDRFGEDPLWGRKREG